jgi:hypothetical protein
MIGLAASMSREWYFKHYNRFKKRCLQIRADVFGSTEGKYDASCISAIIN